MASTQNTLKPSARRLAGDPWPAEQNDTKVSPIPSS